MPTRIGPYLTNFKDIYEVAMEYSNDEDKYSDDFDKWNCSGTEYGRILADLGTATVHIAWYGHGSYEGHSYVLYEKGGKLYENHGSHCSCNGLEGQWSPEETTWKAVAQWKPYGGYEGSEQVEELLKQLVSEHLPQV